jgi:predicted nucleic acid-binding protein
MTRYVIDASVAVKWFLSDAADEGHTAEALGLFLRLRAGEISLVQPPHWKAEVASVLVRRAPASATADMDDLNLLEGIEIVETPVLYHRAIQLAVDLSQHLFDTLYHAAAIESEAVMVTADRRYYDKAEKFGRIVLLDRVAG